MSAPSGSAAHAPRPARRRWIVEGFQFQYLLTLFTWVLCGLAIFGTAVVGPVVWPVVNAQPGHIDPAAGAALLLLHDRLWLPLVLLLAGLGVIITRETHRVAGPLYRFRRVFRSVAAGDLSTRVRIREHDYLGLEARELDTMIGTLRDRLTAIARATTDMRTALDTAPDEAVDDVPRRHLRASLREIESIVEQFSCQPAAGTPPSQVQPTVADDDGFSLVELLIVMGILTVIVALGVPTYAAALDRARIARGAPCTARPASWGRRLSAGSICWRVPFTCWLTTSTRSTVRQPT